MDTKQWHTSSLPVTAVDGGTLSKKVGARVTAEYATTIIELQMKYSYKFNKWYEVSGSFIGLEKPYEVDDIREWRYL